MNKASPFDTVSVCEQNVRHKINKPASLFHDRALMTTLTTPSTGASPSAVDWNLRFSLLIRLVHSIIRSLPGFWWLKKQSLCFLLVLHNVSEKAEMFKPVFSLSWFDSHSWKDQILREFDEFLVSVALYCFPAPMVASVKLCRCVLLTWYIICQTASLISGMLVATGFQRVLCGVCHNSLKFGFFASQDLDQDVRSCCYREPVDHLCCIFITAV